MAKKFEDNLEEQTETVIGPSAIIQGEIISEGTIKIQGQVNGIIKTKQAVLVTQDGKIQADVTAEDFVIGGEAQGRLTITGRLVLLSTAKVAADISCPILKMEKGALYTGKCAMAGNMPTIPIKNILPLGRN